MAKYVHAVVKNFNYTGAKTDSEFFALSKLGATGHEALKMRIAKMDAQNLRDMAADITTAITDLQTILRTVNHYQDKLMQ